MKLIFEQGSEGRGLSLMPECDVPEVRLSQERETPLHLPHVHPRRQRRVLSPGLLHHEI